MKRETPFARGSHGVSARGKGWKGKKSWDIRKGDWTASHSESGEKKEAVPEVGCRGLRLRSSSTVCLEKMNENSRFLTKFVREWAGRIGFYFSGEKLNSTSLELGDGQMHTCQGLMHWSFWNASLVSDMNEKKWTKSDLSYQKLKTANFGKGFTTLKNAILLGRT